MSSNHVLLFVAMSLLIVGIVSSSVLKARALPPSAGFTNSSDCISFNYKHGSGPNYTVTHERVCCWYTDFTQQHVCQFCETDYNGDALADGCGDPYQINRILQGQTAEHLNLTNARNAPTNPPMTTKATGPLNNANAPPTSNTTTGSPPLKSTTGLHNLPINKAGGSNTAPNNPTILSTHHHKTSNLGQTSGSASTGNSTGR